MAGGDWIDGERPGDGKIRHLGEGLYEFQLERFIPRPIERAWAALTIPERLAEWLGPVTGLDLRVGGDFVVWFSKDDGVPGRITEYDPPRVLAFDMNEAFCDQRHRFELIPEAGGCRLVFATWGLRQTTPGMQAIMICGNSAGWRSFVDDLVRSVTGERAPASSEPHETTENRYRAHFGPQVPGHDKPPALRGHEPEPFVTAAGAGFSQLRFGRIFAPSVDKVWAAITEPARLSRWYGPASLDLRLHGDVVFETTSGVDRGFIVALDPGKRIAWALPLADGRHTVVHWEVAPWDWWMATVSRVTLTLRGVPTSDAPAAAEAWMRRLHDLADAAKA